MKHNYLYDALPFLKDVEKERQEQFKEYFKRYNLNRENLHIHACVSKASLPYIYDSFVYFTRELDIINSK